MFTAGSWPSQYREDWEETANSLRQRGIVIYAYGIKPGAQRNQLDSITANQRNSFMLDRYVAPRPLPTGVTGDIRFYVTNKLK